VHGIRFRRNFGKAAALSAGFAAALGDIILTLDADLQDDPAEIPNFLAKLNEGYDVVSGWKQKRLDPWHKTWPSWVFNGMVSWLTGVKLHDHNCGMKCYRAEVFREVRLYGELHRFIPVLAAARGFKVAELPIKHRERKFGYSKYDVFRGLHVSAAAPTAGAHLFRRRDSARRSNDVDRIFGGIDHGVHGEGPGEL
jgi:dolichol-phosphate mannosyltransferase